MGRGLNIRDPLATPLVARIPHDTDGDTPYVFETQSIPTKTVIQFHFPSKIRLNYQYCLQSIFRSNYC